MRQKETTATTRFSLLPGSITRFFLLLIIVLLVTMGVMVQSAVNAWLKDKSYQIVDITHAIQKRVDTWRYVTWQIYDNIAATTSPSSGEGLQETRLVWQVPYGTLLLDTLQNILLPLLLNIGLLALALFGYTTFRHFSSRSTESVPSTAVNNELRILRAINEEIVSLLPLGLLVGTVANSRW